MIKKSWLYINIFAIILLILSLFSSTVIAEIIVPIQNQDQVDISVNTDVQFDQTSGLYTYTYSVTSLATLSQQEVASICC